MRVGDLQQRELAQRLRWGQLVVQIGRFQVCLRSRISSLVEDFSRLYQDYQLCDPRCIPDFHVTLEAPPGLRRWYRPQVRFYLDANTAFKPLPLDQAFAMFEWGLNWCIASNSHQFLNLHAAVVARDDKAVILPGSPGSGKSTLCAALVNEGWRLLSDEMALVGVEDGLLYPVPRPVSLKNASIDVIAGRYSTAEFGRTVADTIKGTVTHMRAPAKSVIASDVPARAACVLFPKWQLGSATVLEDISRAETLIHAAENSFNYHVLGEQAFNLLGDLVSTSRCCRLTYEDLDEAIPLIGELVD